MFDWEPAFCHLVVSRHCTVLCCATVCDMPKSASPTQYFLKQDSASLWCSGRELGMFTVYCSSKGFLLWKQPSEENFCWPVLMERDGSGTWWKLCSKTLRANKPEPSVKTGMGTGAVGAGGPCGDVVSHTNPVPLACFAGWKCSSSLPKSVMWQQTDIPLFLAAKATMSWLLS